MCPNRLRSSAGFTLIAALMVVVIMGILLGASAQSWQMFMKREREQELLFRGMQYRDAITRWYNPDLKTTTTQGAPGPGQPQNAVRLNAPTPQNGLKNLNDLLKDPRSAETKKYLRRLYKDPITNKDFMPIFDATQSIVGVYSPSEDPPVKVGGFPEELKELADKTKYREWQFVYRTQPLSAAGTSGVTGLPGMTGGTTGGTGMTDFPHRPPAPPPKEPRE